MPGVFVWCNVTSVAAEHCPSTFGDILDHVLDKSFVVGAVDLIRIHSGGYAISGTNVTIHRDYGERSESGTTSPT
jgi:hypothetical protein